MNQGTGQQGHALAPTLERESNAADALDVGVGYRHFVYWIPGRPIPMERPVSVTKFRGGAAVTTRRNGKRSAAYRTLVQGYVLKSGRPSPLLTGNLRILVTIFTVADSRGRRGDLSNFLKAFEDAFNRVVWDDDRGVISAQVTIIDPAIRDDKQEGVKIEVWGL